MIQEFNPKFKLGFTNKEITSNPGLAFLVLAGDKLGTRAILRAKLKPTGNANRYYPEVHVLTLSGLLVCGGNALSNVESFREDKAILKILGMRSLTADNTLRD